MSTSIGSSSDTSVTFSLAELAKLEEERTREIQREEARRREARAKAQRESDAEKREEELGRIAAESEARARRDRAEAEEKARVEARRQAEIEVARIAAEAKAKLEADSAARAHEIAILRVRTEQGGRLLPRALAAALAVAVCGGGLAIFSTAQRGDRLEHEIEELRQDKTAIANDRDRARTAELSALDTRRAALAGRAGGPATEGAKAAAESVRNDLDVKAPEPERVAAFRSALDTWQARLDRVERTRSLDRRREDLAAWAGERRRSDVMAKVDGAAALARTGDDAAIHDYEDALDRAREKLAEHGGKGTPVPPPPKEQGHCTDPHDPMCGFDGHSL